MADATQSARLSQAPPRLAWPRGAAIRCACGYQRTCRSRVTLRRPRDL